MGMMPGTMGMATPLACARSTKSKYASGLKKYCVMAASAPACTLLTKCARSADGLSACGCISG
ncbi:Uncharacterised protein [Bordetella pertussis]|nr:Uncharacterised protein [Bordetella pertussis]CPI51321.1 Uncharacterised protein [Bordetella pertussis]CPM31296.1 Uncharacterised protein [Bordetella pertussis]